MHPLLRFTLDLFEVNQLVAPVEKAQAATDKVANKVPEKAGQITPAMAPKKIPTSRQTRPVTAPLPSPHASSPVHFQHPRASREVCLGHARVAYEFKRGQRRSIGFSVGADGLAVRAPKWVTLADVDAALQSKADWILRKLQESRERHARLATQVIAWRDGASVPYLGQPVTIQLDPEHRFGAAGVALVAQADAVTSLTPTGVVQGACDPVVAAALQTHADCATPTPSVLLVSLPSHASPEQIKDAVQAWLMRQAKALFVQRLDHFAPQLGVQWKKLALSNAGTRWGSAKADGSIRLNWRLIHMRLSVIDYVVAHELSHLRVMDHSPRFWDTVRSVMPDYAALRKQLKDEAAPR